MAEQSFDEQSSHWHFARAAFNAAWDLIDRDDRSPEETQLMLDAAHASAWHWLRIDDHTPTNRSTSLWQLSRAYAEAGNPDRARAYADACLEFSRDHEVGAFYLGYAFEALARAEAMTGDRERTLEHVTCAKAYAEKVTDPEHRAQLMADLDAIRLH